MTMIDPYPAELIDAELEGALGRVEGPIPPKGPIAANPLDRIADALEQIALTLIDRQTPQPTRAPLAALPPVQVVAAKPPCPHHGPDRVASSSQFVGFYCQAKASPGQPANPKGYCAWSVRTG